MPSPVGHFLGGAIVGTLSAPSVDRRVVLICAIAACLPDIDFLWGRHNMETHSVGAAMLAGVAALAITRDVRLAIAVAAAWASHVLFDWLGSDTTPPLGVMALWPVSDAYYFASAFFFEAISRRYWQPGFWRHNVLAVISEIAMLLPPLAILWWVKVRWGEGSRGSMGSKVR